ncbi:translation initiation factor [Haladaptatus halobius]|uniref:translation initiation factor n=1 Tax=Haladaptatus halobius TaxID=2884875 RepID=UPI001D0ACCCD
MSIRIDERRCGKAITIIEDFDPSTFDVSNLASNLKSHFAIGTVDDGRIELRGHHTDRLLELLAEYRFSVEE